MPRCLKYIFMVHFALLTVALPSFTQQQPHSAQASSYRLVENWLTLPAGQALGTISWIDFDSQGRAYVFRRCPVACAHPKPGDPPGVVWMFDANGKFLHEWGKGVVAKEAHSLRIDRDGFVWITDTGAHQVKKYAPDGTLLMTLGKYGVPGDGPDTFNMPTDVVVAQSGDIFVFQFAFQKPNHFALPK